MGMLRASSQFNAQLGASIGITSSARVNDMNGCDNRGAKNPLLLLARKMDLFSGALIQI